MKTRNFQLPTLQAVQGYIDFFDEFYQQPSFRLTLHEYGDDSFFELNVTYRPLSLKYTDGWHSGFIGL